jgi:zinc protease
MSKDLPGSFLMMKIVLFLLTILLGLSGCSYLRPAPAIDEGSRSLKEQGLAVSTHLKVTKEVLSNGLTVIVVENNHLPLFAYYTFFKVGGRDEKPGVTGATHFLEHMMFKGAGKYGAGVLDKTIEGHGGNANAYTTLDMTVYHENLPASALEIIVDIEADRMQNLLLEKVSFEKERQVILEEKRMRYENSPGGQLYLAAMATLFEKTPYANPVIGLDKDVRTVSRDEILNFFKTYYLPANAVIVVSGDVSPSKVISLIKDKYGDIPASKKIAAIEKARNDPKNYSFKKARTDDVAVHGASPTPMFYFLYKGEKIGTRRAKVMDILAAILGEGESSWLYQTYMQGKKPLVGYMAAHNVNFRMSGYMAISGQALQRVTSKKIKKVFLKDIKKVCIEKIINARTVEKVKNNYLFGFYQRLWTNDGLAEMLGDYEVSTGDYSNYLKDIEVYDSIKSEEVLSACKEILNESNPIFVHVWDKNPGRTSKRSL